jgi:hypothetical protein
MESRIYSVLFQFNYGIEQALTALDTLEKMDLEPPKYVRQIQVRLQEVAANANRHFTDRVSKQEIQKQLECERERSQQEQEVNPDHIYLRVATAEDIRRQRGLPPRAVILPWTRLDDAVPWPGSKPWHPRSNPLSLHRTTQRNLFRAGKEAPRHDKHGV